MPEEFSRTTARKGIKLPSGVTVFISVIQKISFIDPIDRGQETQWSILNDHTADRKVHVDQVSPEEGGGSTIDVERIDQWNVIDPIDRGQETDSSPDNKTENTTNPPPYFTTHKKTHIYRYYADPNNPDDGGPWVDSELIDEYDDLDPIDRGQEKNFTLNNPQMGDLSGQADPNDPDVTDSDNGIDPPYRTDPYQNIVGFHGGVPGHIKTWVIAFINGAFLQTDGTANLEPKDGDHVTCAYSFADDYFPAQNVSGVVSGMGGIQTVGGPLEYTGPISETLVGNTYSATFEKRDFSGTKTVTWDISGMAFRPDTLVYSPTYAHPHNPRINQSGPLFNVILTGSAN